MITNAERDEIRTAAENYILEVRMEFKIAELGDRIDGATRETGAGFTEEIEGNAGPSATAGGDASGESGKITG
jgi:hypothetical protein